MDDVPEEKELMLKSREESSREDMRKKLTKIRKKTNNSEGQEWKGKKRVEKKEYQ